MIKRKIKEIKDKTSGYMMTAFGLVAGLAWNDAIKSFIEYVYPFSTSGSIWAKFIYAVIITIIVFMVGQYLLQDAGEIPKKKL